LAEVEGTKNHKNS